MLRRLRRSKSPLKRFVRLPPHPALLTDRQVAHRLGIPVKVLRQDRNCEPRLFPVVKVGKSFRYFFDTTLKALRDIERQGIDPRLLDQGRMFASALRPPRLAAWAPEPIDGVRDVDLELVERVASGVKLHEETDE